MRFGLWLLKNDGVDRQGMRAELAAILAMIGGVPSEPPDEPGEMPRGHMVTRLDASGNVAIPEAPVPAGLSDAIKRRFPEAVWTDAARVAYIESDRFDPRARRNTLHLAGGRCNVRLPPLPDGTEIVSEDSVGWFQINVCAHGMTAEHWFDTDNNVAKAAQLYRARGNRWNDWVWTAGKLGLLE